MNMRTRETDQPDDHGALNRRWSVERKVGISTVLGVVIAGATAYYDLKSDLRSARERQEWDRAFFEQKVKWQDQIDNRQDRELRESVEGIRRDLVVVMSKLERFAEGGSRK